MFILITDPATDDIRVFGPFQSHEEAMEHGVLSGRPFWTSEVEHPQKLDHTHTFEQPVFKIIRGAVGNRWNVYRDGSSEILGVYRSLVEARAAIARLTREG